MEMAWRAAGADAKVEPFIERIWEAYAWAHMLVCRAGAMTVFESIASGRPALFIPFAGAANNHQVVNASAMVRCKTAFIKQEREIPPTDLVEFFRGVLSDLPKLVCMSRALKAMDNPRGLETIGRTLAPFIGDAHAVS